MTLYHRIELYFDTDRISKSHIVELVDFVHRFNWKLEEISIEKDQKDTNITNSNEEGIINYLNQYKGWVFSSEIIGNAIIYYRAYIDHRLKLRNDPFTPEDKFFRYSYINISFERYHAEDLGVYDYQNKLKIMSLKMNPLIGVFYIDSFPYIDEFVDFLQARTTTFIPTGQAFYINAKLYSDMKLETVDWTNNHFSIEKTDQYIFGKWGKD
jgi:hypothetical protein